MPLNGNVLGDAIYDALGLDSTSMTSEQKTAVRARWKVITNEIIDHITNNAEVTTNVDVTSVSGVTTGPGSSGPGSGTGSGTVS